MITAVDSNILIDVLGADARFGMASAKALRQSKREGAICACEIVWAEVATAYADEHIFVKAMKTLTLDFSPLTKPAALLAARVWRTYRSAGGRRNRIAADFLIGAHALEQSDRLLTRDKGFYRKYFKELTVVTP